MKTLNSVKTTQDHIKSKSLRFLKEEGLLRRLTTKKPKRGGILIRLALM